MALLQLQGEADLDILDGLRKDSSRSNGIRDDIVKVMAVSQRENGQHVFRLIIGGPKGVCKVGLAHGKEENWLRTKAPPPRRTCSMAVKAAPWTARKKESEELKKKK